MKEIIKALEDFEKAHGWDQYNKEMSEEERIDLLNKQTLNVFGELGEFANELKKSRRDSILRRDELAEELADSFTFMIKLARILDVDIKQEILNKTEKNYGRFEKFRK